MAARIVIKIKDAFFLQKSTYTANSTKLIIGNGFFDVINFDRVRDLYPVLKNAGNIAESEMVFTNLIASLNTIAPGVKLENLFSVIDATEAVNLMQMAKDRSAYTGENLLNFYFIEVDNSRAEGILQSINKLKMIPASGIDYAYIRAELSDLEQESSNNWPDFQVENTSAIFANANLGEIRKVEEAKPDKVVGIASKTKKSLNVNQKIEIEGPNQTKRPETTPSVDAGKTATLTVKQKINVLFSNCGINLGTNIVSGEIKVVDMEQGWKFNSTTSYLGLGSASKPILGGGVNKNDKTHGERTINVLFGNTSYANRINGLCKGANAQIASTWYNSSTTGEKREPALTSTLNTISVGDIVLLELQVSLKGGASKLPVEIEPAMNAVIQYGVHAGFIIIEAAGNGGHNLNSFNYTSSLINLSSVGTSIDAIMVGALNSSNSSILNKGNRVDYYCFGESATTSSGTSFDSTSLASAILTALVANFQSKSMVAIHRRLTINEIKILLKNIPNVPTSFNTFLHNNHIN